MQFNHQPASLGFTAALLHIVQRTELVLKRKIESDSQKAQINELLAGLDVQDADLDAWLEAGGDLLMGQRDGPA